MVVSTSTILVGVAYVEVEIHSLTLIYIYIIYIYILYTVHCCYRSYLVLDGNELLLSTVIWYRTIHWSH